MLHYDISSIQTVFKL